MIFFSQSEYDFQLESHIIYKMKQFPNHDYVIVNANVLFG